VIPAPDEVTSTTATGVSGQQGGAALTTTHWSLVLEAEGESPAAQEVLEKLCRRNIPRQTPSLLKLPLLQIGLYRVEPLLLLTR